MCGITSYSPLAVRAVSVSFNTVPYCAANCLSPMSEHDSLLSSESQSCQRTPIQNAPPKSDSATQGQGSLEWSRPCPSAIAKCVFRGSRWKGSEGRYARARVSIVGGSDGIIGAAMERNEAMRCRGRRGGMAVVVWLYLKIAFDDERIPTSSNLCNFARTNFAGRAQAITPTPDPLRNSIPVGGLPFVHLRDNNADSPNPPRHACCSAPSSGQTGATHEHVSRRAAQGLAGGQAPWRLWRQRRCSRR